jgi:ZU5 domain
MRVQACGIAFLALAAAGCTSSTPVDSKFVKSKLIVASQGGTVSVTSQDSAALAGTAVYIPPNALAQDTTITIGPGPASIAPAGATGVGPVVDLGPSGTAFSSQVTVTLPYTPSLVSAPAQLFVQRLEASGTSVRIAHADLQIPYSGGTLSFPILGFTEFEAVVGCDSCGEPDAGDSDAGRDGGGFDAGLPDSGEADAGPPDAGALDAGLPDAGLPDAGATDAGTLGFACPPDPNNPTAPVRHYPGGPDNPNLGFGVGQTIPDLQLGEGYWNLTTGTPVLDDASFYQAANSFHDLYCSASFKVALLAVEVGWAVPCNQEGQDLVTQGAPVWLPDGGLVFGLLLEGGTPGAAPAKSDLDSWIANHSANYPLVISGDPALLASLTGFPTNIIVDLNTMQVEAASAGYAPCTGGNTCTDVIYSGMATALQK